MTSNNSNEDRRVHDKGEGESSNANSTGDLRPCESDGDANQSIHPTVSREVINVQVSDPGPRPGAYRVNNGRVCLIDNDESIVTPLPEATPVQSDYIDEEDYEIIDGEIVSRRQPQKSKLRKSGFVIVAFMLICVIAALVIFLKDPVSEDDSLFSRAEAIKNILIPISGEEVLDEIGSPQNVAFKFVTENDALMIPLNNTKKMVQRYSVITIGLSIATSNVSKQIGLNRMMHMDECDLGPCNEHGEMIGYSFANFSTVAESLNIITGLGSIPKEIGQLSSLKYLVLYNNHAKGTLPTELGLLKDLEVLDLKSNFFSGPIPTEIGHLSKLKWIRFNNNVLSGTVPMQIGNLNNLFYMDISHNLLSGSIPEDIGAMRYLNGLAMHNNPLSGSAEFLCHQNISKQSYSYEVEVLSYIDSIDLGYSVDCPNGDGPVLNCSCCSCI